MFTTVMLAAYHGATLVFREQSARYESPEATKSWNPVKHSFIVDLVHKELDRREITVAKEEYAIRREGNPLFAILTLN